VTETLTFSRDDELLFAWLKRKRAAGDRELTRTGRVETRHVLLYAKQELEELRTAMLRDDMTSRLTVALLRGIIGDLEGLAAYLETGKGGFSALVDRS
jgi:hypothetical protein